jgi:hypothetical protein
MTESSPVNLLSQTQTDGGSVHTAVDTPMSAEDFYAFAQGDDEYASNSASDYEEPPLANPDSQGELELGLEEDEVSLGLGMEGVNDDVGEIHEVNHDDCDDRDDDDDDDEDEEEDPPEVLPLSQEEILSQEALLHDPQSRYICLVCRLDLTKRSVAARCSHLKACAKEHGVSTVNLLSLTRPIREAPPELEPEVEQQPVKEHMTVSSSSAPKADAFHAMMSSARLHTAQQPAVMCGLLRSFQTFLDLDNVMMININ